MKFYLTAILCAISFVASAGQASADCGRFGIGGFGSYGYYNYGIGPYIPAPPYFALHPPVYYGTRYTRPYGDSPFASPSQLQPSPGYVPTRHVERALILNNPSCTVTPIVPSTAPMPTPANTVPASPVVVKPLVIDNPYFQPEVKLADGAR